MLETSPPTPPRTKASKEKEKKERKRERERRGVSVWQKGTEYRQLFLAHAIKQEADKRLPATKPLMQPRHFKRTQQLALALTFPSGAIRAAPRPDI